MLTNATCLPTAGKAKRPSTAPGGEEGVKSPKRHASKEGGGGVSPQRRSLSARAAPVDPEVLEEKRTLVKDMAEQVG